MTENVSISQSILTSLGGGSGIDIFKLARDLADVEKEPKQLAIQSSIDKSEASISGYAAISFQLGEVKSALNHSTTSVNSLRVNQLHQTQMWSKCPHSLARRYVEPMISP